MRPALSANTIEPLVQAAIAGLGIGCLPLTLVAKPLENGALKQLLPEWSGPPLSLEVVYPSRRGLLPKVRVFVDFLLEHFEDTR